MKNKIVFIINPIAGKGKGSKIENDILNFFQSKNIEVNTFLTKKQGHATGLVKNLKALNPRIIVACGGDGTINEVAQALIGTNILFGIIAIGSGNGLAANLGIPKNVYKALQIILNEITIKIDAGKINERYFFSNIGFGIDADVIHNYANKKWRNFFGYVLASTKSIFTYKPVRFFIEIENDTNLYNEFYFLFCSNSNEAGYGISFSPKAKLNDGKLDFVAINKLNFIQQIKFSISVLGKRINKIPNAKVLQLKRANFICEKSQIKAQIDGEAVIFNTQNLEVSVVPNALQVIIPN